MRREWIEICMSVRTAHEMRRLPPCGGSGLKYASPVQSVRQVTSPSMRREWIEICKPESVFRYCTSPSMRREWIEMLILHRAAQTRTSPSMRREWIEMTMR